MSVSAVSSSSNLDAYRAQIDTLEQTAKQNNVPNVDAYIQGLEQQFDAEKAAMSGTDSKSQAGGEDDPSPSYSNDDPPPAYTPQEAPPAYTPSVSNSPSTGPTGGSGPTGSGSTTGPTSANNGPTQSPTITPAATDDSQGHTIGSIVPQDPNDYDDLINEAISYYGQQYGVQIDPNVIKAQIWQESKGDPLALSGDGQLSRGLMQVSNSSSVPTASILGQIKNPDGSDDPNIGADGGNQYDARTSIFSGVKFAALVMSGKMPEALQNSGLPATELGDFSGLTGKPSTEDAIAVFQRGPTGYKTGDYVSSSYFQQVSKWQAMFASGSTPYTGQTSA